jgi:type II secretory pathway predicted ATPase ExeA
MYGTFFGLKKQPFASVPQTDQYFPAASIEAARVALTRCIQRGEGVGMVIGPTGTGKSLLCRMLAEHLKEILPVAELACGRLSTRRSLFQAILYKLGQPYRDMDEGELRIALVDYLTIGKAPSRGMILIVDEAHILPLRLLDEIRMFTNLAGQGRPLVRLVLAGNALLEERLAGPRMESFNQRISTRCYLEALSRSETQDYIYAQIDSAGGCGPDVFSEEACQSVHKATDGVPRLINQLCDHTLMAAYVAGCRMVEPAQIEEAWADLQQLPTPWTGDNRQAEGGVIEFGRMDDQTDEQSRQTAGAKSGFPSLRVASDFDEVEADLSEVCHQIERIEEPSADLEDDFQPVGLIEPEIELVFDGADHPFKEEFEQEEIVAERYPATIPAAKPVVQPVAAEIGQPASPEAAGSARNDRRAVEAAAPLQVLDAPAAVQAASSLVSAQGEGPEEKPRPVAATLRREYSRLFAKLLQG